MHLNPFDKKKKKTGLNPKSLLNSVLPSFHALKKENKQNQQDH